MRSLRGLGLAFGAFTVSFALHIVGGASGQDWLFAIAVALIFVTATGFPVIAVALSGFDDIQAPDARLTLAIGAAAGYALTVAALWAANGRAFAWWEYPAAMGLLVASSGILLFAWRVAVQRRSGSPTAANASTTPRA